MKHWLLNKLLKHLFNAVTADDILSYRGGQMYRGGRVLSNAEVQELVTGAQALKQLRIWHQLIDELKWVANDRIYNKSVTTQDLTFPKAVLYVVDIMSRKIDNLANLK